MRMAEVFSNVKRINGVDGYILLDGKGNILAHNDEMTSPENISRMVYFCGRKLSLIGKKYFKYASFSRQNKRNVLIFPVGNYYLGIIKKTGIGNFKTASAVMEFLEVLVGKSD